MADNDVRTEDLLRWAAQTGQIVRRVPLRGGPAETFLWRRYKDCDLYREDVRRAMYRLGLRVEE